MAIMLSNGKTAKTLTIGQVNKISAKSGDHYRVLLKTADKEQLLDDVLAKKEGQDLHLVYAGGTEVVLENYYEVCADGACEATLPSETASGYQVSTSAAVGVNAGDDANLVYAHGNRDTLLSMTQGNERMQFAISELNGTQITYQPADANDNSELYALGALGLAGLGLIGVGIGLSSDSNDATVNNTVTGTIVGGPVLEDNDLKVIAYQADGVTVLGEGTVDGTGKFTIDVGSYTGVVIAKVINQGTSVDYLDEATGVGKDLNAEIFSTGVVTSANSTLTLNLNALTTVAYHKALESTAGGPLDEATVNNTNTAIAQVFGLSDLNTTVIVTTNGATTSFDRSDGLNAGETYGIILAALSGADHNNAGDSQVTIDNLVAGITISGETATLSAAVQDEIIQGAEIAGANDDDEISVIVDIIAPAITSTVTATAIDENSGAGQVIYTVTATDSSDITYNLKTGSDAGLTINSTTGDVTLAAAPDFETKPSYSFTVVATDAASNVSEQAVTLAINNLDEVAPTITSEATATAIDENVGTSQVVYTATSTDVADTATGSTVYSLKAATGDVADFSINSSTGAVTLTGDPDFETKPSYSFTVVATDAENNSNEQVVSLAINNLDEVAPIFDTTPPVITAVSIPNIAMNVGDTVTVTLTVDDDAGDTYTNLSGTVGGFSLSSLARTNSTTYTAQFTVAEGGTDVAAGSTIPVSLTLDDSVGNTSLSYTTAITQTTDAIDANSPSAPVIDTVATNDVVNNSEASAGFNITGTGEVGATITLSFDGNPALASGNTATVDGSGNWSVAVVDADVTAFHDGFETIRAIQTDSTGNDSASDAKTITVDTTVPTTTISAIDISADTGTSATDFLTKTAAQTITGTLSATLASGDILYGSVDNGSNWTDITSKVSSTAISWDGATLSGSSSILFKITDAAGNDSATTGSTAYELDTTIPTQTVSGVDISADTGTSATDFLTKTAAQTITGTLSATLASGDILYGSVDNGASWTDITSKVSSTDITWNTATLSGSSSILFKITDAAGNDSATTGSTAYELDTTIPTLTVSSVDISADTGTSATDFLTKTAAQTITGTLSATLASGDILYGSVDNGASWTDITSKVSSTAISWDGATLSGSNNVLFKITDAAGNDSATTGSTAYELDTTIPTLTVSSVDISADTGTSATDFLTKTAAQTITGTLSATLASGDILYGSVDNGASWTDITSKVSSTDITWNTATLSGSNNVLFKITDAAGNDSATTGSTAYELDTTIPTQTVSSVDISADTGTSATDFLTKTAAQTITGTLSGVLATGDILYGSVDNGSNWTDITSKVSSTAITWDTATLSGSNNVLFKITDAAGNDSATTGSTAYELDTTIPTLTVSSVDISADTGTSATDFLTKTAAQTITGTLSGVLATGDILYGSVDNGSNWTDITSKVSSTAISWDGATLSGSNNVLFKITDAAGNDSATTGSTAYELDTTIPTQTVSSVDISADTGTSATDFLTKTAAQTITGTLSATLASGDILYGSVDNGASWTDITSKVSSTDITWNTATLSGSNNVLFKITDAAGNDSATTGSTAYELDTTIPTQTVSSVDISADTGTSATDFLTKTAAQTITGTLSATLASGDILYGSVDNGASWTDITSKVSSTAISWDGATLSGSNNVLFKITDAAGNDSATTGSTAYELDTVAPTIAITDDTASTASADITYTFTLSEASTDFTVGDIEVVGGTKAGAFASGVSGDAVYTLVVTPAANSTTDITVDVAGSTFTDAAGNNNTAATQNVQAVDTSTPSTTTVVFDFTDNALANLTGTFGAGDYDIYIKIPGDDGSWQTKDYNWSGGSTLGTGDKITLVAPNEGEYAFRFSITKVTNSGFNTGGNLHFWSGSSSPFIVLTQGGSFTMTYDANTRGDTGSGSNSYSGLWTGNAALAQISFAHVLTY